MTALKKYARLEASGLWRPTPDDQRREVVVSIGDATLVITDMQDRPLTHWSLAAVQRANPGERPAIYFPDGDLGETLELAKDEAQMIEAIETLRRAVERTRPRPGRLRWLGMALSACVVLAGALFWVPKALTDHSVAVVPQVKRVEIGDALLQRITRMTGPACDEAAGQRALSTLRARLSVDRISILPGVSRTSLHLPGGHILLNRALVEDFEEPDVVAGFAVVEHSLSRQNDPLRDLLRRSGSWASFQLLTTGTLDPEILDRYAEHLLTQPPAPPDPDTLLPVFAAAELRSTPYAYARDITGETVLPLIEADPMRGQPPRRLLNDADWLRLQAICGGT
ncbi:hypothetical protein So717_29980 [Roseobacter cerasinus]|uniref:Uncharacterized protein n=1 Tax=Roseobacter cerasinus TaxID=2602289 RepID=A0A640VWF9_9RHOB|nr:hypothetical protein [Roseobacter cerasinus]GFE51245.1 hypothetical protein So717_29980 [Roseobacter cerasinus]